VALLDKKVLPLRLADVRAGRTSYGHRFLSPKVWTLKQADWKPYLKSLKRVHVILELEERKRKIRTALKQRFQQRTVDEDLVHTTAQLVEEPFFLAGTFSKTYLELPGEVLASCMKKNQKIFACYGPNNKMMSRFVAVLNGKRPALARIRADYENVLESRLKDARYFYDADTREPLESKQGLLEQITYLGKLGNMRDKTGRLEKLAHQFSQMLGRDDLAEDLKRTASLSKADLMTQLVFEFPDLQGIVGREYALESGEKEAVARAIGGQYLPKNLAEDYRQLKKSMTPLGAIFGIVDRLDLLAGAFGTGLEPSGSQDPFALRRAGGSIVKLVRAFRFHFSLSEAVNAAAGLYGSVLDLPPEVLREKLAKFLEERMIFELQPKTGSRSHEILQAVIKTSFEDMADAVDRYEVLNGLFEKEPQTFFKAAKVVERTGNILKGAPVQAGKIDPGLLQHPLEKELYRLLERHSGGIEEVLGRRDYEKTTRMIGDIFAGPLHDFFEQVMVNVEDTAIKKNRQALMAAINRPYTEKLADLSILSRIE